MALLLVRRKAVRRNEIRKERFMRKRNKHISVWMTEQEYAYLKRQAALSGLVLTRLSAIWFKAFGFAKSHQNSM